MTEMWKSKKKYICKIYFAGFRIHNKTRQFRYSERWRKTLVRWKWAFIDGKMLREINNMHRSLDLWSQIKFTGFSIFCKTIFRTCQATFFRAIFKFGSKKKSTASNFSDNDFGTLWNSRISRFFKWEILSTTCDDDKCEIFTREFSNFS